VNLLKLLKGGVVSYGELTEAFARNLPTASHAQVERVLDALLVLVAWALREGGQPLVNLRLQLPASEAEAYAAVIESHVASGNALQGSSHHAYNRGAVAPKGPVTLELIDAAAVAALVAGSGGMAAAAAGLGGPKRGAADGNSASATAAAMELDEDGAPSGPPAEPFDEVAASIAAMQQLLGATLDGGTAKPAAGGADGDDGDPPAGGDGDDADMQPPALAPSSSNPQLALP
jgi:hypothetical protein